MRDLDDVHGALVLLGDLLHLRRDDLAGPAPGGPEVDDDGPLVLQDELLECLVGCVLDGHGFGSFLPAVRAGAILMIAAVRSADRRGSG